jgi:hypothetical protein
MNAEIRRRLERFAAEHRPITAGIYCVERSADSECRVLPVECFSTCGDPADGKEYFLTYWTPTVQQAVDAGRDAIVRADLLPVGFTEWSCVAIVRGVVEQLKHAIIAYVPATYRSRESRRLEASLQIERLRFALLVGT